MMETNKSRECGFFSLSYSCCVVFVASGLCFSGSHCWWHVQASSQHSSCSPLHLNISPSLSLLAAWNQTHTCIYTLLCTFLSSNINHAGCSEHFCRLNSFKISFNYRPSETGETFFFFFLNWQLQLLLLVLFWGQSLMNNICPWRW